MDSEGVEEFGGKGSTFLGNVQGEAIFLCKYLHICKKYTTFAA